MLKKILVVFGTRPEAIKMAPVIRELSKIKNLNTRICVSGQHREMLDQVLEIFDISPNYDLNIMKKKQNLNSIASLVISGIDKVLDDFCPDLVIVHGDTTTTFSSALASFNKNIRVAHVEAGLRTGNILSPWPEEANRKLVGSIATYHFTPTNLATKNLINEGVNQEYILQTGNTVIDALFIALRKIENDTVLKKKIIEYFSFLDLDKKIVLITGHRRESFGKGFEEICKSIKELAEDFRDMQFVYPVHLNPNVRKPVEEFLSDMSNIFLIDPLEYLPFIFLMQKSYLILTDSGGIQEEAGALNVPVLVMREITERPEGIEAGTIRLVGTEKTKIVSSFIELINDKAIYQKMSEAENPFGDGLASKKIASYLSMEL
tara:strand:+ start:986 stop:2113 length:1128 start_codon:yes stop_codon:yes gene_type:complete